tara:strand:+ start:2469 stop:2666 length:198 start_codon:yes stop_codon:yes gene_type:complete
LPGILPGVEQLKLARLLELLEQLVILDENQRLIITKVALGLYLIRKIVVEIIIKITKGRSDGKYS